MKKAITVLGVLVILLLGSNIMADPIGPVSLTLDSVDPYIMVQIDTGSGPQSSMAGIFNLVIDGVPTQGYCVDPAGIDLGVEYNDYWLIGIPFQQAYHQVAWIVGNYGFPVIAQDAANVQMAIWAVMGISITSGWTSAAQDILDAAQAAVGEPWDGVANYMLAVSPDPQEYYGVAQQDFIIERVPEPASLLLLGLGLLGVGLAGRKFS